MASLQATTINGNATITGTLSESGYIAYPLREYIIDLTSQSSANFYPVVIDNPPGIDATWHNQFSIDMVNQSGAAAYNMHSMYGEVRGQGWTDQNAFFRIFHNFYDSAERSILGVYRGTQTFYAVVVYLRGGKNYYVRTTSRTVVGYSDAQTIGNSVFAIKDVSGTDVSGTSANISQLINLVTNPSGFYHSDNAYIGTNQVVHLGTTSAPNLSIGGNAANVTGVVLVPNGGTGVSTANANTFFAGPSSGSTAAAPSFRTITTADIPSNIGLTNPTINNIRMGYTSTATAGGTTTLTVNSNIYQRFTGTTTQTITLPVTSTLVAGMSYTIENISTGNLTVNSSGGNLVITVIPGVTVTCLCVGTGSTTAADWDAEYDEFASITGTGSVVLSTSPTLVTPALGTPASGNLTNCTFPTLNQNTTGTALNVTGTVAIANGGTGGTTLAQARANLGITTSSGTVTSVSGTGTVSGITLSGTVTTTGNLTLGGSLTGTASNLTAGAVTDGVYLSTNQTITGTKTFSNAIVAPNAAKAWVHFNGTGVVAKNADYNVSSIGDNGVGDYTVNFTNALADANYVVAGTATYLYTDNILLNQLVVAVPRYTNAQLAGSCRIVCEYIHGAQLFDAVAVRVVFYR